VARILTQDKSAPNCNNRFQFSLLPTTCQKRLQGNTKKYAVWANIYDFYLSVATASKNTAKMCRTEFIRAPIKIEIAQPAPSGSICMSIVSN
jgi:hypothetical protein